MSESESYIIKQPDPEAIFRQPTADAMEEFMKSPLSVVAGLVTETLAHGPKSLAFPALRIAQATFKGKAFEQLAGEIKGLREKGKLPDNFAEKKNGYKTWVELFTIIDEESPDEDRLEALKAMFFGANKVNADDGERIVAYQLFQIAKRLSSGELLLLKAIDEIKDQAKWSEVRLHQTREWLSSVGQKLGHNIGSLIEHHEKALMENKLITARRREDGQEVHGRDARITDLGIRFCRMIEQYQLEKSEISK